MNTFAQAIAAPQATQTTNGMAALTHTGSELTDLFFNIGSSRNNQENAKVLFARAFGTDRLIATKILFWLRDVREGAGERQTFRTLLQQMEQTNQDVVLQNLHLIPEFGRWDDLLELNTAECRKAAFKLISDTLRSQKEGFQLCAKWMPRKGDNAVALRNFMGLSPKQYRKLLVHSTNVVETAMCSGDWSSINYEHVPSIAAKQYQKAFGRHDPTGYGAYKEKLVSGEAKINASAIFPHDVVQSIRHGDSAVGQAQWDALPNYLGDSAILPMVDVSGSMMCSAGGNTTCMDVAIALGLYIANKQQGAFHKAFLTFSAEPTLQMLKNNDIKSQIEEMSRSAWGMNTNVEKAFDLILRTAKNGNVPQEHMPKYLLIMSDMQFDHCVKEPNASAMQYIRKQYASAGYELPKVVFWNLNAAYGNAPVAFNEGGTALISGFSPSIMKSVLKAENFTPWDVMMETIGAERYNSVVV